MSDLISRADAIDAVCESCGLEGDYHKCDGYQVGSTWCEEITALRNVPSAQHTGHWEAKEDDIFATEYYCSNCGSRAEVDLYGEWILSDFCSHCGADMRGVTE